MSESTITGLRGNSNSSHEPHFCALNTTSPGASVRCSSRVIPTGAKASLPPVGMSGPV